MKGGNHEAILFDKAMVGKRLTRILRLHGHHLSTLRPIL